MIVYLRTFFNTNITNRDTYTSLFKNDLDSYKFIWWGGSEEKFQRGIHVIHPPNGLDYGCVCAKVYVNS